MNKQALVIQLNGLLECADKGQRIDEENEYIFLQIETLVSEIVEKRIAERQRDISDLIIEGHGHKVRWGGELTPGCKTCLDGTSGFFPIRGSSECNLSCDFCYYKNVPIAHLIDDHFVVDNKYYTLNEMKVMVDKQMGGKNGGVMWVYKEPFTALDKMLPLIEYISKNSPRHQWMYTNGTLCTKENLTSLSNAGLQELRFNLAATECSDKVIENMNIARPMFQYLCVESPMYQKYYDAFMQKRKDILATGLDHIHCAELQVHAGALHMFMDEDLYMYRHGYCSPVTSRQLTYDMLKVAVDEKWSVVINDCSNAQKKYRGFAVGAPFGFCDWTYNLSIYRGWYLDVLEKYNLYDLVDSG